MRRTRRGDLHIVGRLNKDENVGFLVAEQNTNIALRYADYGYILENGRIVMDGAAAALRTNEDVKEFYLGLSATGRKSYRDVKHYRRRKRWLAYDYRELYRGSLPLSLRQRGVRRR